MNLSLLSPQASRLAKLSFENVKLIGIILNFAWDILKPETELKRLKRSSMLVMLLLSLYFMSMSQSSEQCERVEI